VGPGAVQRVLEPDVHVPAEDGEERRERLARPEGGRAENELRRDPGLRDVVGDPLRGLQPAGRERPLVVG
jgi:hypothetical protein